jgi:hypothetical protein
MTNVDIGGNVFEECGQRRPGWFAYGIAVVGAPGAATTGTVNIVGNTMRNTPRTPETCNTTGILWEFYSGRIEHNTLTGVIQDCAAAALVTLPGAIFVGSRRGFGPGNPVVRFNDITGNAHAGLRIGPNQPAIDASCNYWGAADGPSGEGAGSGDAVVVEAGGAPPEFVPFAMAPIAGTGATIC